MNCSSSSLKTQVEKPSQWFFLLADLFTSLCSSWVHLEVGDAGNLPGKACLQSLCRTGISARSDGYWEHFRAGFQHQTGTDRQHRGTCTFVQICTDFIHFGVKRCHLKTIFISSMVAWLWRTETSANIFLLAPLQVAQCWSLQCAASFSSLATANRRWSAGSASSAGPASPPGTPWTWSL